MAHGDEEEIGTPGTDEFQDEPEDVYDEDDIDELTEEEDAIEPWEEGFMKGAKDDGQAAKCTNCGKPLVRKQTVEKEYDEETKWFCSETCVEAYDKRQTE